MRGAAAEGPSNMHECDMSWCRLLQLDGFQGMAVEQIVKVKSALECHADA